MIKIESFGRARSPSHNKLDVLWNGQNARYKNSTRAQHYKHFSDLGTGLCFLGLRLNHRTPIIIVNSRFQILSAFALTFCGCF